MIIDFSQIAYITQVCTQVCGENVASTFKVRVMYDESFQKEDLYIPAKDYQNMIEIISVVEQLRDISRQDYN